MEPVLILFLAVLVIGGLYLVASGFQRVPGGSVGIVTKRFGFRRHADDNPQISIYGAAGVQAQTLRSNTIRWLPRYLYEVRHVPLTHVPNGTIGLVVARAGRVRPADRPLARYVSCDHFQDGALFLTGRGEQGRQQEVLTGGYYAINTELFDVITIEDPEAMSREGLTAEDLSDVKIPIGETGVVITHVGEPPDLDPDSVGRWVPDHHAFQQPWPFIDGHGQLGVQRETLDAGGRYSINPWFADVIRIPTRILILDWNKDKKSESNLDASLEQIVLDVQGHTVRLNMKQTVRIPVEAAPRLVGRFGTTDDPDGRSPVQEFVKKDLAATVDGYFRKISAKYRIQEFITNYDVVCNELAHEVRQALEPTGVVAVATTLEEFECAEPEINELRRKIALQQEQVKLEQARLDELMARRDNEAVLDDIERQKIKLQDERRQLELVELRGHVQLLGVDHVRMERILTEWVKAKVPQIISGADGDVARGLLDIMPFTAAKDMLMFMAENPGNAPKAVTNGQPDQES